MIKIKRFGIYYYIDKNGEIHNW